MWGNKAQGLALASIGSVKIYALESQLKENTMQAIHTKFLAPTNSRGQRIVAISGAGRKVYQWNDALDYMENHTNAARLFCQHFNWSESFVTGQLVDGSYVHCFV